MIASNAKDFLIECNNINWKQCFGLNHSVYVDIANFWIMVDVKRQASIKSRSHFYNFTPDIFTLTRTGHC